MRYDAARKKQDPPYFSESTYFICENPPHLSPEAGAGIGTGLLPVAGFHRARPSTTLDKANPCFSGYHSIEKMNPKQAKKCKQQLYFLWS